MSYMKEKLIEEVEDICIKLENALKEDDSVSISLSDIKRDYCGLSDVNLLDSVCGIIKTNYDILNSSSKADFLWNLIMAIKTGEL